MLRKVWPGLHFWYCLGIVSSPLWVFFLAVEFVKKTTVVVSVFLISALVLSWSAGNFMLWKFYFRLLRNPAADRYFRDYKGVGKTTCYLLLSLGNVGLYYSSMKSVAYLLTFLSLAVYCLCALMCIQPYTDFGTLEFLLSVSLNEALSLFGLHSSYLWLVVVACIVIAGIRYRLPPEDALRDEIDLESRSNAAQDDFKTNMSRPGDWNCRSCQHLNFQRRDMCQRCGEPRPGERGGGDYGGFGGTGTAPWETVEPRTLSDVRPGDWYCTMGNCGAHNFASRSSCFKCGSFKEDSSSGSFETNISRTRGFGFGGGSGGGGGSSRSGWKSSKWICTRSGCNEYNFASRMECFKCNAPRDSASKSSF